MQVKPLHIGDLCLKVPVVQGGMGVGISLAGLAGAVAKCHGLGIISTAQIGFRDEDWDKHPIEANLRAIGPEIAKAKEIAAGNGAVGVNIMVATKFYEKYVEAAVAAGADIIISGAGLPVDLPKYTMGSGTKIAPIVSSLKSAQVITRYWDKKYQYVPDAIVIEGPLAGGHLGFSKEDLEDIPGLDYDQVIRDIVAYVDAFGESKGKKIPVIVAGGIYDRMDMEHALSLGASGVQVATRFVTTHECDAHPAYKQTYIDAKKEDIVIVKSPVGMPGRAILNPFMAKSKLGQIPHGPCHLCVATCHPAETPYCITEALLAAATGDVDNALLFCGANAYRASKLESVAQIMKEFA